LCPSATFTSARVSSSCFRRSRSACICSSSCFSTSRFEGLNVWISNRVQSTPHFCARRVTAKISRRATCGAHLDGTADNFVQLGVHLIPVTDDFVVLFTNGQHAWLGCRKHASLRQSGRPRSAWRMYRCSSRCCGNRARRNRRGRNLKRGKRESPISRRVRCRL
jgi:hypothetical protein